MHYNEFICGNKKSSLLIIIIIIIIHLLGRVSEQFDTFTVEMSELNIYNLYLFIMYK